MPVAAMVMVIEMTGGFTLIMPTMLAVAISFLVQLLLTRNAKYPTIYECQARTPADSPVYSELFYQTAAGLLRRQRVHLDRDILDSELQATLDRGEGVALRMRQERLYRLSMPAGSPVAGKEVRDLGLADMGVLIVGVIRGEGEIIPNGGTRLQVRDGLMIAATDESIQKFRAMIEPSPAKGTLAEAAARPASDRPQG